MAHYGNLGNQRVMEEVRDVRGTTIRDSDGRQLGTAEDVIFDHDDMQIRYLVIDSQGWLESGTFLLPANRLSVDRNHPDGLSTDATRKQIEQSPELQEMALSSNNWKNYEKAFKQYWEEEPVMHIKGADRIITPPEEPAEPGSSTPRASNASAGREINAAELFPERMTNVFSDPEPRSSKVTMTPKPAARAEQAAAGVNQLKPRWWDAFENYLRVNKDDIQGKCPQCSARAA